MDWQLPSKATDLLLNAGETRECCEVWPYSQ